MASMARERPACANIVTHPGRTWLARATVLRHHHDVALAALQANGNVMQIIKKGRCRFGE
ncbi:hypothetical protein [Rhizobium sp. S96]|uniref:hypothetical protein n=1 Tax=Rhizobium sp. S96 TaxID=3055140 RepID=UPI0025AA8988|nr:hypothetical protein [Rhizobium sp. S96]MDM9619645.1 hypothetical protein [Rhizobium sp. S96]